VSEEENGARAGGRGSDTLVTEQKRPKNFWSVKVSKFTFLRLSGRKKEKAFKVQGIVKCYFLFPFGVPFWSTQRLEKPRLQQFSNHPISKLWAFQIVVPLSSLRFSAVWLPSVSTASLRLHKPLLLSHVHCLYWEEAFYCTTLHDGYLSTYKRCS
jgi:hypothetical protein